MATLKATSISGATSITGGMLTMTNNGIKTRLGSDNSGWFHFLSDSNKPFYFNNNVSVDGTIELYNTSYYINKYGYFSGRSENANESKKLFYDTISSTNSFASALQSYFNANKNSIPRNVGLSFYSSSYGNGTQLFGYWLSGYNDNPYGGFFAAHYNTPRYIGISSGTYSEQQIITDTSIGDWLDDYLPLTGGTVTGVINRDAGGSWISARDNCIIKTIRTSSEGHDWHPAVGVKTSSGFWSFGSVGGETLAVAYDLDSDYNSNANHTGVIYFPRPSRDGSYTLALRNEHVLKSGDRMSGHLTFDDSYAIEFKGAKDSAFTQFQYRDSIPTGTTHAKGGGVQSKGFYIFTNGYDDTNDYGGLAIDNEGVTVFGAGDNASNTGTFSWNPGASNTGGVFRVINEDNISEGPQFIVTKSSGAFVRGKRVVTCDSNGGNGVMTYSNGTLTIS